MNSNEYSDEFLRKLTKDGNLITREIIDTLTKKGELTIFNSDYLVTKRNDLITAKFKDMTYEELRLIDLLVSLVQLGDKEFKPYMMPISDLMEYLEINTPAKYKKLPLVTKRLMSDVIEIRENKFIVQIPFPWLAYAIYDNEKGIVHLKFHNTLKPFLLGLENNFTRHKAFYSEILKKSKYTLRLYHILKRYEFEKEPPIINLEELKIMLDAEKKEYKEFKRNVIELSRKDINNKSDIYFDYEEIKEKRKVKAIKFIINSRLGQKKDETALTLEDSEEDQKAINSLIEIFEKRLNYESARELYFEANKDISKLKFYYEYCKDRDIKNPDKPIKNLKNYISKIIECEKEKVQEKPKPKTKKSRSGFEQREYTQKDFKDLEDQLLGRGDYADPDKKARENLEDESFD